MRARQRRNMRDERVAREEKIMGLELGLFGIIILAADIWAILKIAGSGASTGAKALWIVLILVLPVLGLILWALLGPRA